MNNIAPTQIGLAEPLVVAIDNGGTNTRIQIRRGDEVLDSCNHETPKDYDAAINQLHDATNQMLGGQILDAAGVSVAGKVSDGIIVSAGALEENGWVGRPLQDDFAEALGVKPELVVVKNDCVMATLAQRVANQKIKGAHTGYTQTISTGNGGAGFSPEGEIPDEPGHEDFKPGVICGCGKDGHVEAHIGGNGIEKKYGFKPELLPLSEWPKVIDDIVEAHVLLINRLHKNGFNPAAIYFFGSIALKYPYMVLPGLAKGLRDNKKRIPYLPTIAIATHGDDSGLVGAGDAAIERLKN